MTIYHHTPKMSPKFSNKEHVNFFFFSEMKGVVHQEFVPVYHTINEEFYCSVLRQLQEDTCCEIQQLLEQKLAPAHTAFTTQAFWE